MSGKEPSLHKNKVAIVGNPNVGKSTLFNQITKSYSPVANFPYTTISVARGEVTIGGTAFEIIDTPGIISLDMQSEDGLVTRDILLREHPELIILCLDTNNIKRSLVLASQLFELTIPVVICLNLVDESRQKGIFINREKLERLLGVPVIETVASEGQGIKKLIKQIPHAALAKGKIQYKSFFEKGRREISQCFPSDALPSDAVVLLLIQKDPEIETYIRAHYGKEILEKVKKAVDKALRSTRKPLPRIIFEKRTSWAEKISQEITERRIPAPGRAGEIAGSLARHPLWGWVILAGVIYVTYVVVGRIGSGIIAAGLDQYVFYPLNSAIGRMVPWGPVREFLVGDYGILTTGFANAVGTVLPILAMFFLVLNVLEDAGYIANLCVLTNGLFKRIGLSGKAVLPIILGFGCKTMATLTTKILESRKERSIAIFLIAFAIPCSPQLGINVAILSLFPLKAFLIVCGVLISIEIAAGLALNKFLRRDAPSDFILEIPPMRLPLLKNLMTKTYYRIKWFLVEAVPLFIFGSCILFFMDKLYMLNMIKKFIFPVIVSFLNLPIKVVDAFLLSLTRKEAGSVILLNLAAGHQLDYVQAIVGTIVMTCLFPCFANIMSMIKEVGIKAALVMLLVISAVSVIIGGIVNYVLRLSLF